MTGKGLELQVHHGRFPAGLHGLRRLRRRMPSQEEAIKMVPRRARKPSSLYSITWLPTSGKKPGCLREETPSRAASSSSRCSSSPAPALVVARPLTLADHPAVRRQNVHLQRNRLLLHLGRLLLRYSPTPSTGQGHGPAWANSLFEDNAEHGFGMYLGQKVCVTA